MNLLFSNDTHGEYPESWYAATATNLAPFPSLTHDIQTDICVIGAGYTGLSAALHLSEAGYSVALIEAHRIGFGASGRNGGQVGSGLRLDQDDLEHQFGLSDAKKFWQVGQDAKSLVKHLIGSHKIDAAWKDGIAELDWSAKGALELSDYAQKLQDSYDYLDVSPLSKEDAAELIGAPVFAGGLLDMGAGHVHPLNYALGLGRAAARSGVQIYEMTQATKIERGQVWTKSGKIKAEHIVLATNGYHDGILKSVSDRVLPINNYIVATEPLGDRVDQVLTKDVAAVDSKFVVNYWRLSADKRLIFGGSESYGDRFPSDIAAQVRKPMLEIYPHLKDVKIDYAWGGTLAITPTRLPDFSAPLPGIWSAAGFSGHGVAIATLAGRILCDAIRGEGQSFELMQKLRPPAFPGMGLMRRPMLNLAMRWFALRDKLGV